MLSCGAICFVNVLKNGKSFFYNVELEFERVISGVKIRKLNMQKLFNFGAIKLSISVSLSGPLPRKTLRKI